MVWDTKKAQEKVRKAVEEDKEGYVVVAEGGGIAGVMSREEALCYLEYKLKDRKLAEEDFILLRGKDIQVVPFSAEEIPTVVVSF